MLNWRGLESSRELPLRPHTSQLLYRCHHIRLCLRVPLSLAAVSPEMPLFVTVIASPTYLHPGLCVRWLSGLSHHTCSWGRDTSNWGWLCHHDHCRLVFIIIVAHCLSCGGDEVCQLIQWVSNGCR
eukprot:jgi/Botrbrau1/14260/Bobra.113_2s0006.1